MRLALLGGEQAFLYSEISLWAWRPRASGGNLLTAQPSTTYPVLEFLSSANRRYKDRELHSHYSKIVLGSLRMWTKLPKKTSSGWKEISPGEIHPGDYPANSSVPKRRPGLDAKDTAVNRTEEVLLMESPFCLRESLNLGTSKYARTFKEYWVNKNNTSVSVSGSDGISQGGGCSGKSLSGVEFQAQEVTFELRAYSGKS